MKTLVVGAAIIDMRMKIDTLPKRGEDVYCTESVMEVGGCAYNVARTMKNMGCGHDLCVPVGTGPYADIISSELKKYGYDILVKVPDQDNGYCLALVEKDGERTFITYPGVEGSFRREWLDTLDMDKYDRVYVVGYQVSDLEGGSVVADWLVENPGRETFFAPGPVILTIPVPVMDKILSVHPVLHLNDKEAMDFTGAEDVRSAAEALYARTGNTVIITLGSEGTAWYDGHGFYSAPAMKTSVVDTVGAGDSHVGAVMGGLSRGYSLEESIVYANRVAAGIVATAGPVMAEDSFRELMEEN